MKVKGGMFRNLVWLSRDYVRNLWTFDYKFFIGLKEDFSWDNMVQKRWWKHLQLPKFSVFLPDSFSFFLCAVDLSFAILYFDYHVIVSFLIIPKRVLIGCYFWAWKTLVEWKKDQKQRTGKPPFESESSHPTASRVRVGSSGSSFFAAVVCCIMKVREMWIHLLELYVSISLLVRLISILSLGWEIRWLNLTTSRNVSVWFKLLCKLCCFTNISTRGPTKPKYLKITVVKINFDMVHISTSYILWRVQVDKETVVRRWESTTTRSFSV